MRLDELFTDDRMTVGERLQQAALDVITPLLAHQVPFITIQNVIDELRATRPGILVDRSLVMDLLDPSKVKSVSKIEGDRIYLTAVPQGDTTESGEDEQQSNIDKVKKAAVDQAKKQSATPPVPAQQPAPTPAPAPAPAPNPAT